MNEQIVILPGDGIGPEVITAASLVLERVRPDIIQVSHPVGGTAINECGAPYPDSTRTACEKANAMLLGAVGDPKFAGLPPEKSPEYALLRLRKDFNLWANLRPVRSHRALLDYSPLKPEKAEQVDWLFVRELTGGLYFGEPKERTKIEYGERAVDTCIYTTHEVERVTRRAFELARSRRSHVTSVDKANVLETSRLWRETVTRLMEEGEGDGLELTHQLVDSCALLLLIDPGRFDVILTENLFGDVLTDEAAAVVGSLGLLPSASIGDGRIGLYEPVHGSAPDVAGKGIANPTGAILSAAMMLRYSLSDPHGAARIEDAVTRAFEDGLRTADIDGNATTEQFTEGVLANL